MRRIPRFYQRWTNCEPCRFYDFASTGETDTATRAIRDADSAGPILAENVADFFGAIVRVENIRLFRRSPPITFPALS